MPEARTPRKAETNFVHLLVIDGLVEGVWTREIAAAGAMLNVTPFRPLSRAEWALVESEGRRHAAFLGAPVRISRS